MGLLDDHKAKNELKKRLKKIFVEEELLLEHYLKTFHHELNRALVDTMDSDKKFSPDQLHATMLIPKGRIEFIEVFKQKLAHDDEAFKKTLHQILKFPDEDFRIVHGSVVERFRAIIEAASSNPNYDAQFFIQCWQQLEIVLVTVLTEIIKQKR